MCNFIASHLYYTTQLRKRLHVVYMDYQRTERIIQITAQLFQKLTANRNSLQTEWQALFIWLTH